MSDTPKTDAFEALVIRPVDWWDFARELERENAKLRERIQQLESSKPEHWLPKSITVADIAAKAIALNVENDALLSELKRQRALWQATHALGLSERDFAIKCIETALAQKEEQP